MMSAGYFGCCDDGRRLRRGRRLRAVLSAPRQFPGPFCGCRGRPMALALVRIGTGPGRAVGRGSAHRLPGD